MYSTLTYMAHSKTATNVLASMSESRLTDNMMSSTLTYMARSRTVTGVLASTSESTSPPSTWRLSAVSINTPRRQVTWPWITTCNNYNIAWCIKYFHWVFCLICCGVFFHSFHAIYSEQYTTHTHTPNTEQKLLEISYTVLYYKSQWFYRQ